MRNFSVEYIILIKLLYFALDIKKIFLVKPNEIEKVFFRLIKKIEKCYSTHINKLIFIIRQNA